MEVKTCSRCNKVKDVNVFGGFKQCNTCRENGRVSNQKNCEKKNRDKFNEKAREKRANESRYCENCGQNVLHENWKEHSKWFRHKGSELNLLLKDCEKKMFGSKLSTEEKEQAKQEFNRKKEGISDI